MTMFYESMKKYEVKESSINEFFDKHFKKDGVDKSYINVYFNDMKKDLETKGFCTIMSMDSANGKCVTFYK